MEVNIFKQAAERKLRFPSQLGELSVEHLYDLPLQGRGVSLDALAIATNQALKDVSGVESFVTGKKVVGVFDMELRLEILKDVIADKLAEKAAAEKRQANAEKRRKILDALAARENEEIGAKSKEELLKELEEING